VLRCHEAAQAATAPQLVPATTLTLSLNAVGSFLAKSAKHSAFHVLTRASQRHQLFYREDHHH
jgi:hypothetical protein